MKRLVLLVGLCAVFAVSVISAAPVEHYFKFQVQSPKELKTITKMISIDNVKNGVVYAYANQQEWEEFLKLGYDVEILPNPSSLIEPEMTDSREIKGQWDTYPTYDAYIAWMYSFETNYPNICRVYDIGTSVEGRQILYVKITDSLDVEEDEPEVLYTGTIHGDEVTGYIMSLHMIDSLLSAYGTDPAITRMVDSMEIWINPASNPDGTYAGGNSSVSGATRYNANSVDLNRNYPDFTAGEHPDGNATQVENIAQMNLADQHSFIISSNFHGGAEVFNYPWDTWATRHADDNWWYQKGREWADTIHIYSGSSYMSDLDNGVTNGSDWYEVDGGRQDYMQYYKGCREVTNEISSTKLPSASQMPTFWTYLRHSLFNYLREGMYGIRGIVTDANTGLPVAATVFALNHDIHNSQVYTDPDVGDYHRMIAAGTYSLVFSAPGYFPDTVTGVTVVDEQAVRLDVQLVPLPDEPVLVMDSYETTGSQPGDAVLMDVSVQNIGGGNANGIVGRLFTDDEYITVLQDTSSYPAMQALGGTGTSNSQYQFSISETADLFHIVTFNIEFTNAGDYVDTVSFEFMIGDRVVFFADDFSTDRGWTGYGGAAEWQRGTANGLGGDPSSDHSPTSDDYVIGNDLSSDGKYNNNIASTQWLTSPVINCAGRTGIELRFWQQLGCESSQYDHVYFQVYNGSAWTTLYTNTGGDFQESSWSEKFYDVSAYADNNADFRIRFGMGASDGSENYSGWNVDDLEIKGYGSVGAAVMALSPDEYSTSLQPGEQEQFNVKVSNTGDGTLAVWFTSSYNWLQVASEKQSINPGDSTDVAVTILSSALAGGDHTGYIEYTSNDGSHPSGSIEVTVHVYESDIFVTTASITTTVEAEGQKSLPLVVSNNGEGRLLYQIQTTMDAVKSVLRTPAVYDAQVIGSRFVDPDKFPGEVETYYAMAPKSSGGPDIFGHQWVDSDEPGGPVYDWVDISGVGTPLTTQDDGYVGPFSIGFPFPLYDSMYTQFYLGANGYITFDTGYGTANNILLPQASFNSAVIAMWWDDMDPPEAGHIYYYSDAANNRLIVSFVGIRNYQNPTGTGSLTFQAILYASGKIVLQYATMEPGTDPDGLAGATIGIQNSLGSDGLTVVHNSAFMHNNLAIEIVSSNWLAVDVPGGTVQPHSVDTVMVLFDATDLAEGDYHGSLIVNSNDLDQPTVTIPVTMTVGANPSCCIGRVGNIDNDPSDEVTLGDLTKLIDMLFISLRPADCTAEADVDMSGSPEPTTNDISLGDLTALIDALFISLNPLPPCP